MNWTCPAITNGVAIYDDGKIRPCCQVKWEYSKPISEINNPNRFSDIDPLKHCSNCVRHEKMGVRSMKQHFVDLENENPSNTTAVKFLDLRHSNLCNAKCRNCGPHHSSKWEQEQTGIMLVRETDVMQYLDLLLTGELKHIYFAGGEPMLLAEHYYVLKQCVELGISKNIKLLYNTNMSTLTYKGNSFNDLWPHFKEVAVFGSADGIGPLYNAMRSDLDWDTYVKHADYMVENGIKFYFHLTVSNLNIWYLDDILKFVNEKKWRLMIDMVYGPEELTLECIPEDLVNKAIGIINDCGALLPVSAKKDILDRLNCTGLLDFKQTLDQQKMYDDKRNENLVELLKQKGIE
jgi:sulfatase maturation enzyme AslB (radical SAM superfamily)